MALLMLFAGVAGAGTALTPCVLPVRPRFGGCYGVWDPGVVGHAFTFG